MKMELKDQVMYQLKKVIDPELGINIVDLGLIYDVKFPTPKQVTVIMTLTTPGCPLHDSITSGVKYSVEDIEEIDEVDVQLVWEPAWTPEKMTEAGKRQLGH
jgi:metal-sulfur cluster biosynthetic enzyme